MNSSFTCQVIGRVEAGRQGFRLVLAAPYRDGLSRLNEFSHALVLWWADKADNPEARTRVLTALPYAEGVEAGVFACRSEYRPNPIGVTVCSLQAVDAARGIVEVPYIDAESGTAVLDIKPYFPVCERVRDFRVPGWAKEWPDWYEDAYKLAELFARLQAQQG